jgi:hypothetical protein
VADRSRANVELFLSRKVKTPLAAEFSCGTATQRAGGLSVLEAAVMGIGEGTKFPVCPVGLLATDLTSPPVMIFTEVIVMRRLVGAELVLLGWLLVAVDTQTLLLMPCELPCKRVPHNLIASLAACRILAKGSLALDVVGMRWFCLPTAIRARECIRDEVVALFRVDQHNAASHAEFSDVLVGDEPPTWFAAECPSREPLQAFLQQLP